MQVLFLMKGYNKTLESFEDIYSNKNLENSNEIDLKLALKLISLNSSRRTPIYFPIIIKTEKRLKDKIRKSDLFVRLSSDTYLILFEMEKKVRRFLKESLLERFENDISFIKVF
jgi:hypothetical protein